MFGFWLKTGELRGIKRRSLELDQVGNILYPSAEVKMPISAVFRPTNWVDKVFSPGKISGMRSFFQGAVPSEVESGPESSHIDPGVRLNGLVEEWVKGKGAAGGAVAETKIIVIREKPGSGGPDMGPDSSEVLRDALRSGRGDGLKGTIFYGPSLSKRTRKHWENIKKESEEENQTGE